MIVIIHGWSDHSASFRKLARLLSQRLEAETRIINLADWLSLDDDVTYADLAVAMQRAWVEGKLPVEPRSVDLVVHSTGALVAREWMTTFHAPDTVPVHRFLMLAPANFGSPLAHKGHSFIGRAVKGWGSGFQTGRQILHGLELASPYTWQLAERDVFTTPAGRWYGRGRVLATVLAGNTGYRGISAIANERGGDGTVRIACANLDALRLELDFSPDSETPRASLKSASGDVAFGVLDGENHSTLALKERGPVNPHTETLIVRALEVTDADFPARTGAAFGWQQELERHAAPLAPANPRLQHTVVHLHDDHGQDIPDYFFEIYRTLRNNDRNFEERFYREVIRHVHPHAPHPAWRAFYLDLDALARMRDSYRVNELFLSVSAMPEFRPPKQPVGYSSFGESDLGRFTVPARRIDRIFAPHRTVLIRIRIPRWVGKEVFRLRPAT